MASPPRTGHQEDDDEDAAALNTSHHSPDCINPPSQDSNDNCDEIYNTYWDDDELVILEDGLVRYASEEPIVRRYEKISYDLVGKTPRDVALRCRLISKRESSKRKKDRKESAIKPGMPRFTFTSEPIDHLLNASSSYTNPAAGISCMPSMGLREQLIAANMLAFSQVRSDLETAQTVEEADRLLHTGLSLMTTLDILNEDQEPQPPLPFMYEEHDANTSIPSADPSNNDADTSSSDPDLSRITSGSRTSTSYSKSRISKEQGKTAGRGKKQSARPS